MELGTCLSPACSTSCCSCRCSASRASLLVPPAGTQASRAALTLGVMTLQFVLTAWLYMRFDSRVAGLQFETRVPWIAAWGVSYHIGLDGFNVLLVLLTAFLAPLVVAGAFSAIQKDVKLFYAMVFLIQFAMMGTLRRAGSLPVLRVLGSDADPDVPADRHLGRRAAHLRHPQVRAVHGVRQHPDAGGDDLPRVLAAADHRA